jgi:hypothetical protein
VLGSDGRRFPMADLLVGQGGFRRLEADATFVLEALPPEPVWIQAYDDAGGYASTQVTPLVGRETEVELRLPAHDPVQMRLTLTRAGEPAAVSLFLQAPGFLCIARAEDESPVLQVTLLQPGYWRGTLTLVGAEKNDLAAKRLLELTAPRQPFEASYDWDALPQPASEAELAAWLAR